MKSFNYKPSRDIQEEFRILEELMSNQNKYNSLKYKQILTDIKSNDDIKILDAVIQLSTELSMAQEDNLGGFQLDILIPELIKCLTKDSIPDIMLHSVVSITHILDLLPTASKILVNNGGIEALCQKMQNFDYIDVAENAIKAIEKVSYEYGASIIQAGGLDIMMGIIDFFISSTQQSIINIILNILRTIPNETVLKMNIMPILPNLIQYLNNIDGNNKNELLCNLFSRLSEKILKLCNDDFDKKQKYLEMIAKDHVIDKLCEMIKDIIQHFNLQKISTLENILKVFNRLCYYSTTFCLEAFKAGIIDIIDNIFTIIENNPHKDNQLANLAYEAISLINSMLALRPSPIPIVGKIATLIGIKIMENPKVFERLNVFRAQQNLLPSILQRFAIRVKTIYEYNVGQLFKYLVLICFEKMLFFTECEDLRKSIQINSISLFISKLIYNNDIMIVTLTTQIIEILLNKSPEIYILFGREGIIEYLKTLLDSKEINKLMAFSITNKRFGLESTQPLNEILKNHPSASQILWTLNHHMENDPQKLDVILSHLQGMYPNIERSSWNDNSSGSSSGESFTEKSKYTMPIIAKNKGNSSSNDKATTTTTLQSSLMNTSTNKPITGITSSPNEDLFLLNKEKFEKDLLLFKNKVHGGTTGSGTNNNVNSGMDKLLNQDSILSKKLEKIDKIDANMFDIESESKPNPLPKSLECEKLDIIKKELNLYIIELYNKIQQNIEKNKISGNLPSIILSKLMKISSNFAEGQSNPNEFGISIFKDYISFINEYDMITKYEIQRSRLIKNMLKFLFNDMLETKSECMNQQSIQYNENITKTQEKYSPNKGSKKIKEEYKANSPTSSVISLANGIKNNLVNPLDDNDKILLELNDSQCSLIIGRLMTFIYTLRNTFLSKTKVNLLSGLLSNLQDMLSNSNNLNIDDTNDIPGSENENYLSSDLKFLATRVKFKVQFIAQQMSFSPKKSMITNTKSLKLEEQHEIYTQDPQIDIYATKEAILKGMPLLALSVEQFGTLEVIEEYLLNKLCNKEDTYSTGDHGFFSYKKYPNTNINKYNKINSQMDYIKEKIEAKYDEDDMNDFEDNDEQLLFDNNNNGGAGGSSSGAGGDDDEDKDDLDRLQRFRPNTNIIPSDNIFIGSSNNSMSNSLGNIGKINNSANSNNSMKLSLKSNSIPIQQQDDIMKKFKPDNPRSKILLDKKKYYDGLFARKEINYKKYLEIKFYKNNEELDKTKTIYEIFCKYRNNSKPYLSILDDSFIIDYKLFPKNTDLDNNDKIYGLYNKEKNNLNKINHILCMDIKYMLSNIIKRIKAVQGIKNDEYIISILQMIIFINELNHLENKMNLSSMLFNPIYLELVNKPGLQVIVDSFKKEYKNIYHYQQQYEPLIHQKGFVNTKINFTIAKLYNDPITLVAGLIPEFYKKLCENAPFLVDFNSKQTFYRLGCFDVARTLFYIYQHNKSKLKELESSRIGKLRKKKIKATRDKILENAVVNMETYGCKKSILEFEFEYEEGTGLGPTLEYYAMVANEMKNPIHNLWRRTDSNMLFPSPIDPYDLKYPDPKKPKRRQALPELRRDFEKFQLIFRCAGTFLARAILDERIVDFPLHPVFWDLVLEKPIYLEDISKIDHTLGDSILTLQSIVNKKQEIERDSKLTAMEKNNKIRNLTFKGCTIEDLALNFTFPGYDEIDLIENGEDMPVTLSNLDQYVKLLTRYYLFETTKSQIAAFKDGFNKVIPLQHLSIFNNEEIEYIICGGRRNEAWDIKTLEDNVMPAHGYSNTSPSFLNLLKIMSEFTEEERKKFLKFITGAERLPFGGFKNLTPKLTVVRKDPTQKTKLPDEYLPSVMTCQNYVKLPDYSSIYIMKERLLYAMKEGQNSFSLS